MSETYTPQPEEPNAGQNDQDIEHNGQDTTLADGQRIERAVPAEETPASAEDGAGKLDEGDPGQGSEPTVEPGVEDATTRESYEREHPPEEAVPAETERRHDEPTGQPVDTTADRPDGTDYDDGEPDAEPHVDGLNPDHPPV